MIKRKGGGLFKLSTKKLRSEKIYKYIKNKKIYFIFNSFKMINYDFNKLWVRQKNILFFIFLKQ